MTADQILKVAQDHFARNGYEGATLSAIAKDVGIKKPSLYAHFSGKEDIFLHVIKKVFQRESNLLKTYLADIEKPMDEHLHGLLEQQQTKFENSSEFTFLLRMSYFPPQSLLEEVFDLIDPFFASFEQYLVTYFDVMRQRNDIKQTRPVDAAAAFLTLYDGLTIELVYGVNKQSFQRRFTAAWPIFLKGIMDSRE
ncbi:TetR/AcrR family transcriptional regulator [Aureibacillus halotolerans]|uniref:TetR/AcrR family transcriptional regulator n=1 Tax=Aureibacillus halotolerans TaxID=1508390 RepID=UPI001414CE00|nr:TetR/AcrR family transcriptional regulator [Aureibacillus halotolerans]